MFTECVKFVGKQLGKTSVSTDAWSIEFDGACEPNPGGFATFGWLLRDKNGTVLACDSGISPYYPKTSNTAEWAGLLAALNHVVRRYDHPVGLVIRGDSRLVLKTLTGAWRSHKPHLTCLREQALVLLVNLGVPWTTHWIPRDNNWEADELSHWGTR